MLHESEAGETLKDLLRSIGQFAGSSSGLPAIGGALLTQGAMQDLKQVGRQARAEASELAETLLRQTEFRPFSVTSSMRGTTQATPEGGLRVGLSDAEQDLQEGLLTGSSDLFEQVRTPRAQREQEIKELIRSIQRPEEERARLALEERLFNQGRSDVNTAMFDGTPEEFELDQATQENRLKAALAAIEAARQEQMDEADLASNLLRSAYVPQASALDLIGAATPLSDIASRSNITGAELFGQSNMAGIDAILGSSIGRADLTGTLGSAILTGLLTPQRDAQGNLISSLSDTLNPFSELFGDVTGAASGLLVDLLGGSSGSSGVVPSRGAA